MATKGRIAVAGLIICLLTSSAWAYGPQGHQAIGAIADQLLTPTTKARVHKILDMDLQTMGPWADCARDAKGPDFVYKLDQDYAQWCSVFSEGAEKKRIEDYVRGNWTLCTKTPWDGEACPLLFHYTDVSVGHNGYGRYWGTSDHDVVAAVSAAILVLAGEHAPSQFKIASQQEALLMLAHFVGDLHQPLHVGAVYLNASNEPKDPDQEALSPNQGGNALFDNGKKLHGEWDSIPADMEVSALTPDVIAQARLVPTPVADPMSWASIWASETLLDAKEAFPAGTAYAPSGSPPKSWSVTFPPGPYQNRYDSYAQMRDAIQRRLIIKAGARLAQVLNALYGSPQQTPFSKAATPYLPKRSGPYDLFPSLPAADSAGDNSDELAFLATRSLIGQSRGDEAQQDDMYNVEDVAPLFKAAFGRPLDGADTAWLRIVLAKVTADDGRYLAPLKQDVVEGGRLRPFVAMPNHPTCPITWPTLKDAGSYPSGHAMLGWLWASVLAKAAPDRAELLFTKAESFAQSRVVCGFHYPSDIQAGRAAASKAFDELVADKNFNDDLACATAQMAGKRATSDCTSRMSKALSR